MAFCSWNGMIWLSMSNGQQKKCKVRESQCSFPFENYDGTNLCFKSSLSLPSPTLTKARFNSKFVVLSQNTLSLRLVGRFAIFSYRGKTKRKPCTLCKNRFWSNNPSYEKGCIFPKDLVMIFVPSSWLVCNCWWRLPEEALSFSTTIWAQNSHITIKYMLVQKQKAQ